MEHLNVSYYYPFVVRCEPPLTLCKASTSSRRGFLTRLEGRDGLHGRHEKLYLMLDFVYCGAFEAFACMFMVGTLMR